jgi:hypothetical protein
MWHHSFDPHSVPEVPSEPLEPIPSINSVSPGGKPFRTESIKNFLDRSDLKMHKSLVMQALDRTVAEKQEEQKVDNKLHEWSKKTGLSVETLSLI